MFVRLLSIGILAATLASAQYGGGGGGGRGASSNAKGAPVGMPPLPRIYQIGDMLGLDKDQRKQVMTILDDAQKEAAPVRDRMPAAQLAIAQAIQAGRTQDEIAKTVDAYAALDTGMTAIELRTFSKIAQILREDQKVRMPGFYRMLRGLFNTKDWNDPSGK
jgi:hypothetical protein